MVKLVSLKMLSMIFAFSSVACASDMIWNSQGETSSYEEMLQGLLTQRVIILGENHGLKTHQNQHMQVLQSLREAGSQVHVGLEFFSYPDQALVEAYKEGQLTEAEFLESIRWQSPSYDYYRDQALFPQADLNEKTWALNAPRTLTSQVAKSGIESLPAELRRLLPPNFQLGRDSYRQRFLKAIGGDHFEDPTVADRYFAAQSIWDDTMAWRIRGILDQYPQAVVVVIVGEFHVQYGGGLPDRLQARGVEKVATVSQVNSNGLSSQDLKKEVDPDQEYGPRADWIWTAPAVE